MMEDLTGASQPSRVSTTDEISLHQQISLYHHQKAPGQKAMPFISLIERIQNLPQELQDSIKDALVACELPTRPTVINTKSNYKPPLGLQLDRKTRENFAKAYYEKGVVFKSGSHSGLDLARNLKKLYFLAYPWLSSLSRAHCELIGSIQFDVVEEAEGTGVEFWGVETVRGYYGYECSRARQRLDECLGVELREGVVCIKDCVGMVDGRIEVCTFGERRP